MGGRFRPDFALGNENNAVVKKLQLCLPQQLTCPMALRHFTVEAGASQPSALPSWSLVTKIKLQLCLPQ